MFNPKYSITSSILNKIAKISEVKNLIENSNILPERENFLRKVAIVKMAHSSTSIEGNILKQHQVEAIQEGKSINAEGKQILEVKNYLKALNTVDLLSESEEKIDLIDIKKIHGIVMHNLAESKKVGDFRKSQVYIPPEAKSVERELNDLLSWLNSSKDHPIIKAAIFHYQFESIHPFTDGNGRTGRLLTLLNLYQSNFKFKKILVLEDYYNSDREKYYKSLQTGNNYNERVGIELTQWIEYFVDGFLQEVLKVRDQVLSLKSLKNRRKETKFLDKDEVKIIDFVLSFGKITSDEVVDILDVPKRTAQNKLAKLVKNKSIKKQGSGPATYYSLNK